MNRFELLLPYGADSQTPTRAVIHAMGEFVDDGQVILPAHDFLKYKRFSAHSLIHPSGVNLRQRLDNQGAHHAKGFNTDSLGMEILVPGIHNWGTFVKAISRPWVTHEAYLAAVEQMRDWISLHELKHIDTHHQLDPGRKPDPGEGFPWDKFLEDIRA